MRAADPRTREILERTESLSREELMRLHGTIREFGDGAAAMSYWEQLEHPAQDSVTVDGVDIRRRSRVRLRPKRGADVFDGALDGKTAVVEKVVESMEGGCSWRSRSRTTPGRDLGEVARSAIASSSRRRGGAARPRRAGGGAARILVAGIGNVFFGDDGFGVAVAAACRERAAGRSRRRRLRHSRHGPRLRAARLRRRHPGRRCAARRRARHALPDRARASTPARPRPDAHGDGPGTVLALAQGLATPCRKCWWWAASRQRPTEGEDRRRGSASRCGRRWTEA